MKTPFSAAAPATKRACGTLGDYLKASFRHDAIQADLSLNRKEVVTLHRLRAVH